MKSHDTPDLARASNHPRVHFETPETDTGVDVVEPDEYHTEHEPFLTCLWLSEPGVERKVLIPLPRVIRIEA